MSASSGNPGSRARQRLSAPSSAFLLAGLSPHPGPIPGSMSALTAASTSAGSQIPSRAPSAGSLGSAR